MVQESHVTSQGVSTQFSTVVTLAAGEAFMGMGVAEADNADKVRVLPGDSEPTTVGAVARLLFPPFLKRSGNQIMELGELPGLATV